MFLKYFRFIKDKEFTKAIACLPPFLRFRTAKQQWMASRLGLYKTVSTTTDKNVLLTRRQKIVRLISQVKRNDESTSVLSMKIYKFLNNRWYRRFHYELVTEVVGYQPEPVLKWLGKQDLNVTDDFYICLNLSLISEYTPIEAKNKWYELYPYIENKNAVDVQCLRSNILKKNTQETLSFLSYIFAEYKLSNVQVKNRPSGFSINNLHCHTEPKNIPAKYDDFKVTVLVTACNSTKTLNGCVQSLINQTWSNIEIIIVNDASSDDTWNIMLKLNKQFEQVHIVNLPINVGTFAAKSIGLLYAKGKYITCQDSDDWAHSSKIEEQIRPLIEDSSLVATTSYWLRVDEKGNFHVRQFYPFLRQNPASPMFELEKIKKDIGLWHIVRTGADSEFFERLKLYYGKDRIHVIKKPLTIASHRQDSLMTSNVYGAYTISSRKKRLDYWEAWRTWHINCLHENKTVYMPDLNNQAQREGSIFKDVPLNIIVSQEELQNNLIKHIYIK